jgi:ribosomal protein S12 methylthiotransferase accessory factor
MDHQIVIDGAPYAARKGFYHGTQRTAPPERTLARIWQAAPTVGLTRLADITGLDRIGIPTVVGHRPNAPTLATSGGKGFTTIAATVSAGMEAVEIWHAENVRRPVTVAPFVELHEAGMTIAPDALSLTKHSLFDPTRPEPWVTGWDIVAGREVLVPYASVSMGIGADARQFDPPARWMPFATGSNGLAGGNHLLESVAAGLYEVCERDAIACTRAATGVGERVDLDSITDPLVRSLLDQYDDAGITTYLFDNTVDTQVPTYSAVVADRIDATMGLYRGYGAHLDPAIAMIRALTEAAQARLLLIAGSRDDYFGRDQRLNRFAGAARAANFDAIQASGDASRHASGATDSFGADIATVLDRLSAAGLDSVIVVDLTDPDLQIPVARVIVPGLEGYIFDHYAPGPRALAHRARVTAPA